MFDTATTDDTASRHHHADCIGNTLQVVSVPARHPYISEVRPKSAKLVATHRTVNWEPDPIFQPGAVTALPASVDVIHVHFSFDHLDVATMRAWLAEVRARHLPLVVTVHDLRNPHHEDSGVHERLLAELLPAAAAVITLTSSAAAELFRRYRVRAHVLPHPTMVDPGRTADVQKERGLVTLNLKFLRRNVVDPLRILDAVTAGAADGGGRVRVDVQAEAMARSELAGLQDVPDVDLRIHPPFSDLELERYVRRAHVAVLPYRWGTHSGWLELAKDLGTRIVAPDCGAFGEQWSEVVTYVNNEQDGLDVTSLRKAVAYALQLEPLAVPNHAARQREAAAVRQRHEAIYRAVAR